MIIAAIYKANQKVYESQSCTDEQKQIVTDAILADALRDGVEVDIIEMATNKDIEQYILTHQ